MLGIKVKPADGGRAVRPVGMIADRIDTMSSEATLDNRRLSEMMAEQPLQGFDARNMS